jgi:hypothetical protein
MQDEANAGAKERILKRIIAADGPIVIKDDPYNCYRITDKAGVLCMDNCSPRENYSYSEDPIELEVAWQYARTICPDKVESYAAVERTDSDGAGRVNVNEAASS